MDPFSRFLLAFIVVLGYNVLGFKIDVEIKEPAMCTGGPNADAKENVFPIYDQLSFKKILTCPNGELYEGGPTSNNTFHLLRVSGTAYEQGYAHGSCLKQSVINFQKEFWNYISYQLSSKWFITQKMANETLKEIINERLEVDKLFIPDYIQEELHGLSDGSGVPYMDLLRFHVLSELNGFHCSMFGAYGNATEVNDGTLLQLRALDYDTEGPQKNYPLITVYDTASNVENSHKFATVGCVSFVGSITGISTSDMSISEIGVDCPDDSFGNNTVKYGYPFIFVLRDILQFDDTLNSATDRLINTHRTVDLILGVGDNKIKDYDNNPPFNGYQYSGNVLNVFNYSDLQPDAPWHPKFNDIVYWGMDWDIAGYDKAMAEQFDNLYGNITAENTVQYITSLVQTGDYHIAIYDYVNNRILLSFHSKNFPNKNNEDDNAYNRQFTAISLDLLFNN